MFEAFGAAPPAGNTDTYPEPSGSAAVTFNTTDVAEAFDVCMAANIDLFDTSEVYGYQSVKLSESSELLLCSLAATERATAWHR